MDLLDGHQQHQEVATLELLGGGGGHAQLILQPGRRELMSR